MNHESIHPGSCLEPWLWRSLLRLRCCAAELDRHPGGCATAYRTTCISPIATSRSCEVATPTRATQLGTELDDLRDEVVYLKVKLRKERTLARTEYADVRDRIEDLRSRARGDVASRGTRINPDAGARCRRRPPHSSADDRVSLDVGSGEYHVHAVNDGDDCGRRSAVGTEIDVRLQNALNSGTAQVEDRFEATTLADVDRRWPRGDPGWLGAARRRHRGRARRRAPTARPR